MRVDGVVYITPIAVFVIAVVVVAPEHVLGINRCALGYFRPERPRRP